MTRRKNPYLGDPRTQAAKARGYPARSVFKLEEIDQRTRLLAPGQSVLDLGAAPGSWSLFASDRVGAQGRVLAVDIQPIAQRFPSNVEVRQGDALDPAPGFLDAFAPYDVVLSDMAPSTSGNKVRDQALSFELFESALTVAARLGKPGAHFAAKLFMGPDFGAAKRLVTTAYEQCRVIKPRGTRSQSTELFLVGLRRR